MNASELRLSPQKKQTEKFFHYGVVGTSANVVYNKETNSLTVFRGITAIWSKYVFGLNYEKFLQFARAIMEEIINSTSLN